MVAWRVKQWEVRIWEEVEYSGGKGGGVMMIRGGWPMWETTENTTTLSHTYCHVTVNIHWYSPCPWGWGGGGDDWLVEQIASLLALWRFVTAILYITKRLMSCYVMCCINRATLAGHLYKTSRLLWCDVLFKHGYISGSFVHDCKVDVMWCDVLYKQSYASGLFVHNCMVTALSCDVLYKQGYASGSFGPTTAGRMDAYVAQFQQAGGSMIMLAKGNRSKQVRRLCLWDPVVFVGPGCVCGTKLCTCRWEIVVFTGPGCLWDQVCLWVWVWVVFVRLGCVAVQVYKIDVKIKQEYQSFAPLRGVSS